MHFSCPSETHDRFLRREMVSNTIRLDIMKHVAVSAILSLGAFVLEEIESPWVVALPCSRWIYLYWERDLLLLAHRVGF